MRRRRLLGLFIMFGVVVAACDWPMYGYGPDHTRYTPDLSISRAAAASGFSPAWSGNPGGVDTTPAIVGGVVYVGSDKLYAFDAAGKTNCSGTPATCTPLWVGITTGTGHGPTLSTPAVVDGVVYAQTSPPDNKLYAFDAAGKSNCSGTPTVCGPLWTATTGPGYTAPVVANGMVYVTAGRVFAFDAKGMTNCAGAFKMCQPLWETPTGYYTSPAIANGFVYAASDRFTAQTTNTLDAFDAAVKSNCSGVPLTCTPLWSGNLGTHVLTEPSVSNGVVYVGTYDATPCGHTTCFTPLPLFAFDAKGNTNCSGTPKQCSPLWKTSIGLQSPVAISGGALYVTDGAALYAFDARGTANCSGTPKSCAPLWRATAPTAPTTWIDGTPIVAYGVVYVTGPPSPSSTNGWLYAFDSSGQTNCSGTPKTCAPLSATALTGTVFFERSPAISNGTVYVGTLSNGGLEALKPKHT